MIENDLFNQDWRSRGRAAILQYISLKWTLCFLVGILAGAVGFFNNLAIENLAGIKFVAFSKLMLANKYWLAFGMFAASNLALLLSASTITSYISTAAAGSGIPEVKAYLNGVDAPDIFSLRTLVVKAIEGVIGFLPPCAHLCSKAIQTEPGSFVPWEHFCRA